MSTTQIRGVDPKVFQEWKELVIADKGQGRRRGKHSFIGEGLTELMQRDIAARTRTDPGGDPTKPLRVRSKRDQAGLDRVKKSTKGVVSMLLEDFDQTIKDAWGVRDVRALENLRPMVMDELNAKPHKSNPKIIEISPMCR